MKVSKYLCICVCVCVCVCVYVYIQVWRLPLCEAAVQHVYMLYVCMYFFLHVHVSMIAQPEHNTKLTFSMHACMCICMHISMFLSDVVVHKCLQRHSPSTLRNEAEIEGVCVQFMHLFMHERVPDVESTSYEYIHTYIRYLCGMHTFMHRQFVCRYEFMYLVKELAYIHTHTNTHTHTHTHTHTAAVKSSS